mgnify:CR=1 FL=1|nr:MAG TPA: hypothetical protein [Caudoviricetes sp.]
MRVCKMCGADISSRPSRAKYCFACAVVAQRERARKYKAENKETIKEYQKEYQKEYRARNKDVAKEDKNETHQRVKRAQEARERERLEEEKSWELLRQAFGDRFGRTHKHVNTMSQLEKDVAEAARLGISYGEYEARKRKGISK